mmetsp:Transcript_28785/g.42302  ORF Transcript_28785/g.42302 Transcript_28785/m.42302 type:complete len:291 (-) Transcript_28785:27-899(-)
MKAPSSGWRAAILFRATSLSSSLIISRRFPSSPMLKEGFDELFFSSFFRSLRFSSFFTSSSSSEASVSSVSSGCLDRDFDLFDDRFDDFFSTFFFSSASDSSSDSTGFDRDFDLDERCLEEELFRSSFLSLEGGSKSTSTDIPFWDPSMEELWRRLDLLLALMYSSMSFCLFSTLFVPSVPAVANVRNVPMVWTVPCDLAKSLNFFDDTTSSSFSLGESVLSLDPRLSLSRLSSFFPSDLDDGSDLSPLDRRSDLPSSFFLSDLLDFIDFSDLSILLLLDLCIPLLLLAL